MTKVTDQQIIDATEQSATMFEAARIVGLHPSSFIPRAKRLGIYKPNPGRVGVVRTYEERIKRDTFIPLSEILNGSQPQYGTAKLRKRLIEEGIKILRCEMEGCSTTDKNVPYVLDHIDGNSSNHLLCNLRILCPNCHSKTETFAGKNKTTKKGKDNFLSDKEMLLALIKYSNIRVALLELGLKAKGANYKRAARLLELYYFIKNM